MANGFEPSQLQQIGDALGGISAGIQGTLPQLQQARTQEKAQQLQQQKFEQQQLEIRQKAVFTDSAAALQFLNSGDLDSLVALGINRLESGQQIPGADFRDTQRLTQLGIAARNGSKEAEELLRNELETNVKIGKSLGIIPKEEVPKGQTDIGKLSSELKQGLITQEQFDKASQRLDRVEGTAQPLREQKIADLRAQGLDRADAANIVDGNVKMEVSDTTGNVVLTNLVDGSVKEVAIDPSGEAVPEPERGQTLFELAPKATGLASGISAGISRVGGQVGAPVDEEVLQARQTLRIAKNGLIRSLSINPRFPVAEIKRIEGEVNLDPSLFNSPEAMQADMIAMDRALRLRMSQELRDANDPAMSEKDRGDARSAASDINNFLTQLGAPEELDVSMITIDTIPTLDKIDLNRFIQSATDEELNALPADVAELLFERIESGR